MLWSGNKKGYMRTLEVMLAFILTFSFMMLVINQPVFLQKDTSEEDILKNLVLDTDFRNGVFDIVGNCVDQDSGFLVANLTALALEDHSFYICNDAKPTLPKKNVYVDSAVITGNITALLDEPYVKLYYWK